MYLKTSSVKTGLKHNIDISVFVAVVIVVAAVVVAWGGLCMHHACRVNPSTGSREN